MAEAEDVNVSDSEISSDSGSDMEFEGFEEEDIRLIGNVQRFTAIWNPDYDREVPKDLAMNWSSLDTPPTLAPFTRNVGLTVDLADDASPLEFFKLLFNENYWEKIVTETNTFQQKERPLLFFLSRETPNFHFFNKKLPVFSPVQVIHGDSHV